jgi:hypothetical protein
MATTLSMSEVDANTISTPSKARGIRPLNPAAIETPMASGEPSSNGTSEADHAAPPADPQQHQQQWFAEAQAQRLQQQQQHSLHQPGPEQPQYGGHPQQYDGHPPPPQPHYMSAEEQAMANEREFLHLRGMLPHVPAPALVAVLQSLLDDFPQLTPIVRSRCEAATFIQQPPMGGGGQWQPDPASVAHPLSQTTTPPGAAGRSNRSRRAGRGDDEYQPCAVHGGMRAAKHLSFNAMAQQFECIPGFHCLESSNKSTPMKTSMKATPQPQAYSGTSTPPPQWTPAHLPAPAVSPMVPSGRRLSVLSVGSDHPLHRSPQPEPASDDGLSDAEVCRLETLLTTLKHRN